MFWSTKLHAMDPFQSLTLASHQEAILLAVKGDQFSRGTVYCLLGLLISFMIYTVLLPYK